MAERQVIRGAGGGGKRGSGQRAPREEPNTLRSRSIARVIDLLCEGPVRGLVDGAKSIYFGETPVQNTDGSFNFQNFAFQERVGTPSQLPVPGFNTVETSVGVGVEVLNAAPVERQFPKEDLDGVRVVLQLPSLSFLDSEKGDLKRNSVTIAIDVKSATSAYRQVVLDTIEGKTVSQYERGYRVNFTGPAPWSVRVRRVSPDPVGATDNSSVFWAVAFELIDAKMVYPNSAYIASSIDSEGTGGQVPVRGFEIEGLDNIRVPVNYDPETRTYDGIWNGTFKQAYTNNPAWVMHEILTNTRWGLGQYIDQAQVNKFALYEIGRYCDEMVDDGFGGQEPRYTFNGVLNTAVQAYEAVQAIASNFRAMSYWGSGAITFAQDAPKEAVQLVSPANVIDGVFNYSSSGLKDRFTVCYVTYNNPKDFYRPAIEVYEDAEGIRRYGWRKTDLLAVGCTSRGQARRMGKWAILTALNEREFIQYRASYDHVKCRPGDIVMVADPAVAGIRLAGRIKQVVANSASHTLVLDAPVQLTGNDSITLVQDDGQLVTRTLASSNEVTATVETTSLLPAMPRVGSMFLIGTGTVQPRKWRVLSVREDEPNIYEITAVEYRDEKFGAVEQGLFFSDDNFSAIPSGRPNPPSQPNVTESLYRVNNAVRSRLSISWQPPANPLATGTPDPRISGYYVLHQPPGGNFRVLGRTEAPGLDLDDCEVGLNEFRVYAETSNGLRSAEFLAVDVDVVGKSAPPADVQNLTATPELQGILLSWDQVTDIDLVGYDVRVGSSWENSQEVSVRMKGTQLFVPVQDIEPRTFLVRAIDDTGNYSVNTASVTAQVTGPDDVLAFIARQDGENVIFSWRAVPGIDVEYEIRVGLSWDLGQRLVRVSGTTTTILFPADTEANFWIKAKSKLGIYSQGTRLVRVGLANPAYRNVLYFNNLQDTGFPGTRIDMTVDTDTDTLVVDEAAGINLFGDYFSDITLPANLRARNWLSIRPALLDRNTLTWQEATFEWNSAQASEITWSIDLGNESGARFDAFLSVATGFKIPEDVEAWSLTGSTGLTGLINDTAPLAQAGVAFAELRDRDGVASPDDDTLTLTYEIAERTLFSILATVRFATPNGDAGRVLLKLSNADGSEWIKVGKLPGGTLDACTFRCEDHLERVQDVTLLVGSRQDFFSLGISQDSEARRFVVSSWRTGATGFHELEASAITTLNRLHLHDD
jgi:predicted phage tail protein